MSTVLNEYMMMMMMMIAVCDSSWTHFGHPSTRMCSEYWVPAKAGT